ncbi:TonB-dependent receptor [Candidatus Bandiella numerosa]|jgi:opacity protein-like surface antigen|uniref:outer membrane protein n=1 Tax=Candidatus Bandiella numerosa TaxID=2570586 RepID=UPI00249E67B2|nr:outer membrane beta-barrel protein [Candidatus Bandiella numerosa]WHA04627.1 TonB-dependent receptor [Candidatus Bandiella numerosa]
MNKLYHSISILLTSFCIYGVANSEDFYLRADLGAAQSNSVSNNKVPFYKNSKEKKFTKGFAYSVGIGYELEQNLRTELAYHGISNLKYSANIDNNGAIGSGEYKQKLKINALMANIIYDIQLPSNYSFNPYLGVGLGYAKLKPGIASINAINTTHNYKANKSDNFTYAISGGVAFHLTKQFMLDIGYKFQDFGKVKKFSSWRGFDIDDHKPYKGEYGFKVRIHSMMAGIRYIF